MIEFSSPIHERLQQSKLDRLHELHQATAKMTYYCKICASELRSALRVSPQSDEHVHDATDRACGECWEAWLSLQVEEKRPSEIQRMFCEAKMDAEDIRKFGRRATAYR